MAPRYTWDAPVELTHSASSPFKDDEMAPMALLALFLSDPAVFVKPDAELGAALNETKTVFLDSANKRLWLKSQVAIDRGVLEMFLCRRGTKEHESIVAVDSPAFVIHAGLLAMGLEPGATARFDPEYQPPTGPKLEIVVHWQDADGTAQSRPASEWIRRATHRWHTVSCAEEALAGIDIPKELDLRYIAEDDELIWFGPMSDAMRDRLHAMSDRAGWREAIDALHEQTKSKGFEGDWVFAGSGFWVDQDSGERHYLAESGNLICVANFGDAMIDIDVESSAENDSLLYEPWSERMPAVGTPVLVEIRAKAMSFTTSVE